MRSVLFTAPAVFPVALQELLDHLHLAQHDEDPYLAGLIRSATSAAEEHCWSRFCTQTWDLFLDDFIYPDTWDDFIPLPWVPVSAITFIKYNDPAGVSQTVPATVYGRFELSGVTVVRLLYSQVWPSARGWYDDVQIRYVAGYGDATAVPDSIKQAIKLHAEAAFLGNTLPEAFYNLLAPFCWKTAG